MKIKIKNLVPFELLASYSEQSTEQVIQEAYTRLLNVGDLTKSLRKELEEYLSQNDPSIVEFDIELTLKQQDLLDKLMMNRSMDDINSKAFELTLAYLMSSKESQDAVDKFIT